MTLEYACIAPHGTDLIPGLASSASQKIFLPTRKGIRRLARDTASSRPDTIIIASPHNLRLVGKICVVVSENSTGTLTGPSRQSVKLSAKSDKMFASELLKEAANRGLPVVGANYGTAEGSASDMPMDWGTLVPLWFLLRELKFKTKIVIVTPSREIPLRDNFQFGKQIGKLAVRKKRRFAFVASADQAHAHSRMGPYGFSEAAARYDRFVCRAISENRLKSIMRLDRRLVEAAKPDSLWQMTILAGILDTVPMSPNLISYDVPTYYGMTCASFLPIQ